ncbi:MAG: DUF1579 family protein, partial [Armatimonadota bacterium]
MSTQTIESPQSAETSATPDEAMMGTKPVREHAWLQQLVGEWRSEGEMTMGPDQPKQKSVGTESVKTVGGLWAFAEGRTEMPGGEPMTYYTTLGYDVSFKEYRGC